MSYDIWLTIDTGGEKPAMVADIGNYTSNVSGMWCKALGRPLRELHGCVAGECIDLLKDAVSDFAGDLSEYEKMNPENGWGSATGALNYLRELLEACRKHPKASIEISW